MKAFVVLAVVALAAAAPEPPSGGYDKAPQQGGYDDAALSSLGSIDIAQLLAFARSQQRARASAAAAPSANYGAPAAAAGPASRAAAPASGYSAPSNAGGYSSSGRNPGGYSSGASQQQTQQSGGYSSSQQSQQSGGYSAPAAPAPAASSGYSAPAPAASSGYSAPAPAASSGYSAPAPAASSGYSAPAPAASSGYAAPAKSSAPASQYGAPGAGSCDQATGAGCNGNDGNNGQESSYEQKVHKHVYIHVAPEEPKEAKAPKAAKAPLVPEKHYKILFIRAPTPPPYEQPEIEDLPPAPEQKTLVYVLLKKPDATPAIQLSTPAPTKPSKPEVYFIRYKSPESQDANSAYGAPAGPVVDADAGSSSTDAAASPDAQYGAPARQNGY